MHDRTQWTKGTSGDQNLKGRKYKNLTEFYRPCATCGENFSIYVTPKIACGEADSNSFALRNCPDHRRSGGAAISAADLENLRTANATMRQELETLYERDKAHFAENQELKARLATYELSGALRAEAGQQPTKPLTFPWANQ